MTRKVVESIENIKKYGIIYADPPWHYNQKNLSGAAEHHYRTMSIEEICKLKVAEVADQHCVLFLWATFPQLPEALKVIKAWGFQYKTGHLSEELYQQISTIPHVEHVTVEHSAFANISYQGASFLQSFYPLTADSEEYFTLEAEGNNSYDYLSEHDGILITNSTFSESINGIDFQPGDTVTLHYFDGEEHTVELEIAAVSEEYVDAGNDRPTFCMADTTMQKLWNGMNTASMFYITADNYTQYGVAVEEEIRSVVEQYDDLSLWTLREQSLEDSFAIRQQKQQIYGISILLILFSIFNLINTVISGFATRKRELSVLESLGMEQRQLRKMLFCESIIQMLPSLILTFSVGTLAGFALIQFLQQSATYLQYTFPIMAAIFYLLALWGLPLILTAGCLHTQEKIPLVERIRYVE